jgi:hypothetical protein
MFKRRKADPRVVIVRPGDMLVAVDLHSIGVETFIDPQKVADLTGALKDFCGLKGFVAIGKDTSRQEIEDMLNHKGHDHGAGHSHGADEPHHPDHHG